VSREFYFWSVFDSIVEVFKILFLSLNIVRWSAFPVQSHLERAFCDSNERYSGLMSLIQGYFQSLGMKKDLIDLKKKG